MSTRNMTMEIKVTHLETKISNINTQVSKIEKLQEKVYKSYIMQVDISTTNIQSILGIL